MKRQSTQSGSLHAVIIVVLFVALMATLGVVFYQNFVARKPVAPTKETTQNTTKTTTNETARLAFNSDIYALDYPQGWKESRPKDDNGSLHLQSPSGNVGVRFVLSGGGIGGTCDQAANEKITSYVVQKSGNTKLTGDSLFLVEALYDHKSGGYDYHIGLTEDGGATHAAIGEAFCNVAYVGVASTLQLGDNNAIKQPLIIAEIQFPQLDNKEGRPASQDMETIKDLMTTNDYKAAVKILESARKE